MTALWYRCRRLAQCPGFGRNCDIDVGFLFFAIYLDFILDGHVKFLDNLVHLSGHIILPLDIFNNRVEPSARLECGSDKRP